MEFLYGSTHFPATEVIREMGYEFPEQLRERGMAEKIEEDPRVIQAQVDSLLQDMLPEAAAAAAEVSGPQLQIQQMQEQLQLMQAQMQMMQQKMQMQQMQNPQPPGLPQPGQPPQPGGQPPATVAGGPGGSPAFGQSPGAPGRTNIARAMINPGTALAQEARQQSAIRSLQGFGAQEQTYGGLGPGGVGE